MMRFRNATRVARSRGRADVRDLQRALPGSPTELQRLVLAHDWAATPVGPVEQWPPVLRNVVALTLNTRFPMLVMWGPELVMVYNDGYAEMLGNRHPGALGRPMGEVWADVWDVIGPMLAGVLAGGDATHSEDLALTMGRYGFHEETYFTFSYSPVHDERGRVLGLIDIAVETTSRVLAERRLRALQRLGSLPHASHGSAEAACASALEVLAGAGEDVRFAAAYLGGGDGAPARLVATSGVANPAPLRGWATADRVRTALERAAPVDLTGLARRWPGLVAAGPEVDTAVVVPLTAAGQPHPVGALLLGVSPHLHLDEEYRTFLALAAGQVAATVTDAQAVEVERRRNAERAELEGARTRFLAEVAETLQRAVLGPTALPAGVAVHYAPATASLQVGGDWYDVVDLGGGRSGVVVGDVVGRGLPAAAVMGQLRSAARALLLEARSPARVLEVLDGFAELVPGAAGTTVFCGVLDPAARAPRDSRARHPPAMTVSAEGQTRLLEEGRGLPLAVVQGLARPEGDAPLPPASALLLYTDGLVERRGEVVDEGIARAAEALTNGRHL